MNREKLKALYLKYELTSEDMIYKRHWMLVISKKTLYYNHKDRYRKNTSKRKIKVAYKLEV